MDQTSEVVDMAGEGASAPLRSANTDAVRRAVQWIRNQGGAVTAEALVSWDRTHGRQLFEWDDTEAAEKWRLHQARLFLSRWGRFIEQKIGGKTVMVRVSDFRSVREDADLGIEESGYVSAESISQHEGMRKQVIRRITKHMATLAAELRFWKLSEPEREEVLEAVRQALAESTD